MRLARSAAPRNRDACTQGRSRRLRHVGQRRNDTHLVCKFDVPSGGKRVRVSCVWKSTSESDARHRAGVTSRNVISTQPATSRPQARPSAVVARGVNLRMARYVVAGFKSSMRAANGSSLSSIIGYSTPGSSSSNGPSSKGTWGHRRVVDGRVGPLPAHDGHGLGFVCERGSSLRPFVACAARVADLPQDGGSDPAPPV